MLPDFRFLVGAVIAAALLGVTFVGFAAAIHLSRQSKVSPLETPRLFAYVPEGSYHIDRPVERHDDPFAHIRIDPNAVPLRQPSSAAVELPVQIVADAPPENAVQPESASTAASEDVAQAVSAAPLDDIDMVDERAVVYPPLPIEGDTPSAAETAPASAAESAAAAPLSPAEPAPALAADVAPASPVESAPAPSVDTVTVPATVARIATAPEIGSAAVAASSESTAEAAPVAAAAPSPAPMTAAAAPLETMPAAAIPVAETVAEPEAPAERHAAISDVQHVGSTPEASDAETRSAEAGDLPAIVIPRARPTAKIKRAIRRSVRSKRRVRRTVRIPPSASTGYPVTATMPVTMPMIATTPTRPVSAANRPAKGFWPSD